RAPWRLPMSVGIGWSMISRKSSSLSTISSCNSPGNVSCAEFRLYQMRASHEIESGAMNHGGALALHISSEDRCAEDPLERSHKPPILGSALMHAEGVQHLSRAAESNNPALLLNRKGREEDRYQPVLAARESVCR